MSEKTIKSRIVHKHDLESNWLLATNFTPKQGELIIYDVDENYNYERLKVGDGVQNVNDLPFYVGSWEDLADKPFWSEGPTTIEWDGNTDGLKVSSDGTAYKVSDLKPSSTEIVGGKLVFSNGSVVEITSDIIETGGYIYSVYYGTIYVNTSNGSTYSAAIGVTLPEPGIYLQKNTYNQIVSFSYGNETVHYLDEKYIPDTIARVTDIPEQIADDALSSTSTNPVQNKVVNTAISTINTLIGDSSVSEQISKALLEHTTSHAPSDAEANVQSNWNEDSDTSDAYILNKPSIKAGGGTASIIVGDISSNTAEGDYAYAGGRESVASGHSAHAEGYKATASESFSYAQGRMTKATGYASHAEGTETVAKGYASHAEGMGTIAGSSYQHVQGLYNIEDTTGTYMHIVGNGGGSSLRSNAHTLDKDGNAWFAGDVYVGGTNQSDADRLVKQSELEGSVPVVKAATLSTEGWYRVATSAQGIYNCIGTFRLNGWRSSSHTSAIITAGTNYGRGDSSKIGVLHCGMFGNSGSITKARLVYHTTYSGNYAYLELYVVASGDKTTQLNVEMSNEFGWTMIDPVAGSIPSGYTSKEVSLADTVWSDINVTSAEINQLDGITDNVQAQLNNLSTLIGDTAVSEQITDAVDDYLPLKGGKLTGNLSIDTGGVSSLFVYTPANSEGKQGYGRIYKNASATADYGLQLRDYTHGNTTDSCALVVTNNKSSVAEMLLFANQVDGGANTYYKIYGEHNKPTPADIGAIDPIVTYYAANTNMSADNLVVPTALVATNSTLNAELYNVTGGSFAYVMTLFYTSKSTTSRRMQIGMSYNSSTPRMAIRHYGANGWTPWARLVTTTELNTAIADVKAVCLPKVASITLRADYWVFNANAYYQDVPLNCVTTTSKVDLQPTYYQLAEWQTDGLAFSTESKNGVVRVWVTDVEPKEDITIQVTVQEVLEV